MVVVLKSTSNREEEGVKDELDILFSILAKVGFK